MIGWPYPWPEGTQFEQLTLQVEDKRCPDCGKTTTICDHRFHHVHTLGGPLKMTMKLTHCPDKSWARRSKTLSPKAEFGNAMPDWAIAWDVFAWIGHRRFSRHWSVPQIRYELIAARALAKFEQSLRLSPYQQGPPTEPGKDIILRLYVCGLT